MLFKRDRQRTASATCNGTVGLTGAVIVEVGGATIAFTRSAVLVGPDLYIRSRIDISIHGTTATTGDQDVLFASAPTSLSAHVDVDYGLMDVWSMITLAEAGSEDQIFINNCLLDDADVTIDATFGIYSLSHTYSVSAGDYTRSTDVGIQATISRGVIYGQDYDGSMSVDGTISYSTGESYDLVYAHTDSHVNTYLDFGIPKRQTLTASMVSGLSLTMASTTGAFTPPYSSGVVYEARLALYIGPRGGYIVNGKLFADRDAYPQGVKVKLYRSPNTPATNLDCNPTFTHTDALGGYDARFAVSTSNGGGSISVKNFRAFQAPINNLAAVLTSASLLALGERYFSELAMSFHGQVYDAFALTHAETYAVDDGSTIAPSGGSWTGSADVSVGSSGGTIVGTVSVGAGGNRMLKRAWASLSTSLAMHCYRYLKVRLKLTGKGASLINIYLATFGETLSGGINGRYRLYTVTSGSDGEYCEFILDLCSPDEWGYAKSDGSRTAVSMPAVETQTTRYPLPTDDLAMWGAGKAQYIDFRLPSNGTDYSISVDSIDLIIAGTGQQTEVSVLNSLAIGSNALPTPLRLRGVANHTCHPFLTANTNGRKSLEVYDIDDGAQLTIDDLIDQVNYVPDANGLEYPGFAAVAATPADTFHTLDRTAKWIGGRGYLYVDGAFEAYADKAVGSGLTVKAQPRWASITWYPGCGDALGLDDGAYGDYIKLFVSHSLRGAAEGILINQSRNPANGVVVKNTDRGLIVNTGATVDAGQGSSDLQGYYRTGLPHGRGQRYVETEPQGGQAGALAGREWVQNFRHRASFRVQQSGGGGWNMQNKEFGYHSVGVQGGSILYSRSNTPTPYAYDLTNQVVAQGSEPRMEYDSRGILYVIYSHPSGDVHLIASHNDGLDWTASEVAIPNTTRPTISNGPHGMMVQAGYRAGNIIGKNKWTGEGWSSEFTFVDDAGVPIEVRDDSFHLVQGDEGPGRWILTAGPAGEDGAADWWSGDDGRTWRRIV